jgi:hypothetical protein
MHYRTPLYDLQQPVGFENTSSTEPCLYSPEVRRVDWVRRNAGPVGSTASQRAARRELRALHPGLSVLDVGRAVAATTTIAPFSTGASALPSLPAFPTLPTYDDDNDEEMDDTVLNNLSNRIGPVLEHVEGNSRDDEDQDSVLGDLNGGWGDSSLGSLEGTVNGSYTPNYTPGPTPDRTPDHTTDRLPAHMPDHMPDHTPDHTPDPVGMNTRPSVQPRVFVRPGPKKVSGNTPIESVHQDQWWHRTAEEIARIPRAQMRNQTYHVIRIMETTLGERLHDDDRCTRCVRDGYECWVYSDYARKQVVGNAGHKCARCRAYDSQRPCNRK